MAGSTSPQRPTTLANVLRSLIVAVAAINAGLLTLTLLGKMLLVPLSGHIQTSVQYTVAMAASFLVSAAAAVLIARATRHWLAQHLSGDGHLQRAGPAK